jgi:hypothetical protein
MTQEEDKTILDKAKDLATDIKEKVAGYVGENEEKIHGAVEKTGDFIDDKTKGRFSDKIDKAQDAAKNAVTKLGAAGPGDGPTPGAASTEPADSPAPVVDPDAPAPE